MSPANPLASMRYCHHNGGHPVRDGHYLTIPMQGASTGLPLYAGCDSCLMHAVVSMDIPAKASLEPHLKELLIRARAALTQPTDYTAIDALIRAIDAAIALAD